ncbi:MarR family transcriptional regulator [Levilactobacillus brevis]|nr:MarR family transcriptional regulator [Levilactobacillus brevis]
MVEQEQPLLDAFIDVYMSSLKYLDEFISEPAQAFHLSFEQYLILREITQNDQVTLMDIASKRQVTRSAISRQIKVLLKAGYLQRINQRFQGWLDVYGDQRAHEILDFIRDFSQVTQMKK